MKSQVNPCQPRSLQWRASGGMPAAPRQERGRGPRLGLALVLACVLMPVAAWAKADAPKHSLPQGVPPPPVLEQPQKPASPPAAKSQPAHPSVPHSQSEGPALPTGSTPPPPTGFMPVQTQKNGANGSWSQLGNMRIFSNSLSYDVKSGLAVFKGKVYVQTDEYQFWADEVDVRDDAKEGQIIDAIVAPGQWIYIQHQAPGTQQITKARSHHMVYYQKNSMLVMQGDARIDRFLCDRLVDTIAGEKITYYQKEDRYNVQGSAQSPTFTALSSNSTLESIKKQCQKP